MGDVTQHNIKQLKTLNTVVFPVLYNDKFYIDVLEAGELAKLAYYNDIVVGAVCCRIDTSENQRRLYIMTLGCLFHHTLVTPDSCDCQSVQSEMLERVGSSIEMRRDLRAEAEGPSDSTQLFSESWNPATI